MSGPQSVARSAGSSPSAGVAHGWRRLAQLTGDRPSRVVILLGVSIASALAEAGVLALLADVAAAMVTGRHQLGESLGPLGAHTGIGLALIVAIALALARLLLRLVVVWLPARISAQVQAGLRRRLFDAFSAASWSVQSQDRQGHLQELMSDQINQATQVVTQVVAALSGAAMFLTLVASAFSLNAVIAVIVLASAALLFCALRPMARLGGRAASDLSQANMDHAEAVSESTRLAEEAQVFGVLPACRERVSRSIDLTERAYFRLRLMSGLVQGAHQSLVILLVAGGLAGLYVTGAGHLAALGAVILMLVRSAGYAQQLQGGYHYLKQIQPYLDRLDAAVARYRGSPTRTGALPLAKIESLALEGVTFSYRPERTVLREITFEVAAGETIAIVGPSGAGKSTLAQLLLWLREPQSGRYLVNGTPVAAYDRTDWQRLVAYVAQEPRVLDATVAENIRFFRPLDNRAIESAARLAHIHQDIVRLPSGYDTMIGQTADAVSGGQRQRLCLARALAGRPAVLVLDEPTSALDLRSEAAVQRSLAQMKGEVTLFVVAHTVSALAGCDRALVLSEGEVEAFAPVEELAQSILPYRALADPYRAPTEPVDEAARPLRRHADQAAGRRESKIAGRSR